MFATTIRFTMPAETDWEKVRQLSVRRAFELYRTTPGLRALAVVFSPERGELGGNYVWETQDHAEAFLRSEPWRAALSWYGAPRIERAEVCAYVEDGDLVFPAAYDVRSGHAPVPDDAAAGAHGSGHSL